MPDDFSAVSSILSRTLDSANLTALIFQHAVRDAIEEWSDDGLDEASTARFADTLSDAIGPFVDGLAEIQPLISWIPETSLRPEYSPWAKFYQNRVFIVSEDIDDYHARHALAKVDFNSGLPSPRYSRVLREFSNVRSMPVEIGNSNPAVWATSYHEAAIVFILRILAAASFEFTGLPFWDVVRQIHSINSTNVREKIEALVTTLRARWTNGNYSKSKFPLGYFIQVFSIKEELMIEKPKKSIFNIPLWFSPDDLGRLKSEMRKELLLVESCSPSEYVDESKVSLQPLSAPDGPIPPSSFQWRGNCTNKKLTATEYKLLTFIFERQSNPPTVQELKEKFWPKSYGNRGSYDRFATGLRKKLNPIGATIDTDNGHVVILPLTPSETQ